MVPGLSDIEAAARKIAPYVRWTPLVPAHPLKNKLDEDFRLCLKLENMQITGSFKARGAVNKLLALEKSGLRGLVTASGGNHGLGVAYAGRVGGLPVTVYLPVSTPESKARQLESWGATVVRQGAVWDDANRAALERAEQEGWTYIHPFADPLVIAGQGTLGLEILSDRPELDTLLVAIGGGGLISGIALAAHALKPDLQIIGIEPEGAPTLRSSLEAGYPVELASITTRAGTLAPRRSEQLNFDIISRHVREIVLVSDLEMEAAQGWLFEEFGLSVELSAAAAMAALLTGKYRPAAGRQVGVLVCGSNSQ